MKEQNGQSKLHSFYESLTNVLIGYVIAIGSQMLILPLYDIHVTFSQNLTMGLLFTIISFVRNYILRRWFNNITFS
jgi:hypothetical protein